MSADEWKIAESYVKNVCGVSTDTGSAISSKIQLPAPQSVSHSDDYYERLLEDDANETGVLPPSTISAFEVNIEEKQETTVIIALETSHTNFFQIELSNYKTVARLPIRSTQAEMFEWWRAHKTEFPLLAKAARILHSIPPSSIASERLFSKGGLIYANRLRSRLSAQKANLIMFLKSYFGNPLDEFLACDDVEDNPVDENEDDIRIVFG